MAVNIEVVYAEPKRQRLLTLQLADGATVADALAQALHTWRLELPADTALGIYGETVTPDRQLQDKDRVEIYRPLLMDPKTARLQRAKEQNT